jgi:predicted CoA-binding protein
MSNIKKTLVIGASDNRARYSFLAVNILREHGHPVLAIGNRTGKVSDVSFSKERPEADDIDTITLYLNPKRQQEYYDYILSLHPKRIIFNPGTENEVLEKMASEHGIQALKACTLVLLSTGRY